MNEAFVVFLVFVVIIGVIYGLILWARTIDDRALRESSQLGDSGQPDKGYGIAGAVLSGAKSSYEQSRSKAQLDFRSAKYEALEKLKSLHDRGVLSDQEYETERVAILGK